MRSLLFAAVLVYASAQFFFPHFPNGYVDRHDGYVFEFHIRHSTFVVRSHDKCYIMDVTDDQYEHLQHRDERYKIEDQMMTMIKASNNLQHTTFQDLITQHHDAILAAECRNHELLLLDFFPHSGGN